MLEGKKTKTGGIALFIAGGLYIGGLYDAILYDIGIGLAMMGAGLVCIGIHNRISRGLFHVRDGKILYGQRVIHSATAIGE